MFGLNKLTYIIDVSLMAQHFNKQWSNKHLNNKERKISTSIGLFNSTWPLDILELLDFFTVRPFPLRPTEMNDAFKFNQCFESPARLNCFKT